MRATARDVLRHPTWLGSWWLELPMRRRSWWRQLLFEPGAGWLRWGLDDRVWPGGWYDPPDEGKVAPPLRRMWFALRWRNWEAGWHGMVCPDRDRFWGHG